MSGERFLGTGSVYGDGGNHRQVYVPADVVEALGDPGEVAWFVDADGDVYAVATSEVGFK